MAAPGRTNTAWLAGVTAGISVQDSAAKGRCDVDSGLIRPLSPRS
jgi:hypothetical protein